MDETEGLVRILRERARRHGRSLEQELHAILDAARTVPSLPRYRRSASPRCARPGVPRGRERRSMATRVADLVAVPDRVMLDTNVLLAATDESRGSTAMR